MKKPLILGILILTVSMSAMAKASPNLTNPEKVKKDDRASKKRPSCSGGMAPCANTYTVRDNRDRCSDEENLASWDLDDFLCN